MVHMCVCVWTDEKRKWYHKMLIFVVYDVLIYVFLILEANYVYASLI
jgi:hypothetical protein